MESLQIRDSRDKLSEPRPGEDEMADRDRQPSLRGFTPEWDLKLFLEAQSAASEKIVSNINCFWLWLLLFQFAENVSGSMGGLVLMLPVNCYKKVS